MADANGNGHGGLVRAWNDRLALIRHGLVALGLIVAGVISWQSLEHKVAWSEETLKSHNARLERLERLADEQRWLNGRIEERGRQQDQKLDRLDRNVDRLLRSLNVPPAPRQPRNDSQ